jgi:hypothetical protein
MVPVATMDNIRRSRQFKVLLSREEWYALLAIAEADETTISDVFRAFVVRRAYELEHPETRDVRSIANTLLDLSRRLRTLAAGFERGLRPGLESPHQPPGYMFTSPRPSAANQGEWHAPNIDPMVIVQGDAAGGQDHCDEGRNDTHDRRHLDERRPVRRRV